MDDNIDVDDIDDSDGVDVDGIGDIDDDDSVHVYRMAQWRCCGISSK